MDRLAAVLCNLVELNTEDLWVGDRYLAEQMMAAQPWVFHREDLNPDSSATLVAIYLGRSIEPAPDAQGVEFRLVHRRVPIRDRRDHKDTASDLECHRERTWGKHQFMWATM